LRSSKGAYKNTRTFTVQKNKKTKKKENIGKDLKKATRIKHTSKTRPKKNIMETELEVGREQILNQILVLQGGAKDRRGV